MMPARNFTTESLNVPGAIPIQIDATTFDSRTIAAIVASRDAELEQGQAFSLFDVSSEAGETFLFKVETNTTSILSLHQ